MTTQLPSPDPRHGPRVSDEEFFGECVDVGRAGMEGIAPAVDRGDLAEARRIFVTVVRGELEPERYMRVPRPFLQATATYSGETIKEAAERILRLELVSCSAPHQFHGTVDWSANPTQSQYREWTYQLNRHPEWVILAMRYQESGDERYAEGFVNLFRSWVRQAVVPVDAPGNTTRCWRTIEAGIRMGTTWPTALHAFFRSPHFADDVLVDWYKSVWEHGRRLRRFHRSRNWLIMELNGLAHIGILYPQLRSAREWRTYAFASLAGELGEQVHPDGFHYELSTNYYQVVIRNYEQLRDVCDAYEVRWPNAFDARLEAMHAVNVGLMRPDGYLPDLNDGRARRVAPLLERAVERYPDRADFRWAHTGGGAGRPPATPSVAFPNAGYYVLRSGWDTDAVWALFDGGPFGFGHQHEDKLNVLLHAYGRQLLTEAGNYAYDDSPMRHYVRSTRAHNTIRVDSEDQNRALHFDRGSVDLNASSGARWHSTPTHDAVDAVYDGGYGPDAARSVSHHRRLILLKKGVEALGPMLIVVDRLRPRDDAAHTYEVLWHMSRGPVSTRGTTLHGNAPGVANLAIVPASLEGLSLRLIEGQTEPEWQGWSSVANHQQGECEPTPAAVYDLTAVGPVRLVTVLCPVRPGARCPARTVWAVPDVDATTIQMTLADGHKIGLDERSFAPGDGG